MAQAELPLADAIVLFGATGDLSRRMLLPSLYFLDADGLLPVGFNILATARAQHSRDEFVDQVRAILDARPEAVDDAVWARFSGRIDYVACDATTADGAALLKPHLDGRGRPMFFLAISPSLYSRVCAALAASGLATEESRIVLEKPIGRDLESSRQVNEAVGAVFAEDRIFRIDHYLGKETVQNLIALRFANTLFEPLWNNLTIDHVQITVAETEGVGDRWPYYDEYGALRDMLQNHMLQLLCFVAMEPPADMDPRSVRNEKVKVLRSLRRFTRADAQNASVRGQYTKGVVGGKEAAGYETERGQPTGAETFAALRVDIDNWRWAGVPFFLRTGKRLPERRTQIVIQFKPVPHSIFGDGARDDLVANRLVIDLQPDEDIALTLMNKSPGISRGGMRLQSMPLSLSLLRAYEGPGSRRRIAYERLLLDVVHGNSTLFVRRDEVEEAWRWVDGVADAWAEAGMAPKPYAAGSWGPSGAFALIERSERAWVD
ncbi:MAG TPA: glucose-6-phosphate dehydrogenase [Phenylobacterium sp.]|jgi:glucose-6-phosphate 1-dehydrogenase|uniref:glucose-6-phosphate dehydrogenase n=1 Tax=Phenylobacterium sp. TaxID=1871053 RepID=UPI002CE7DA71|nr:glucose-6-phosphate dehydrogenase [Phenylobacterium sp.]HXA38235.1 glucose-6-phosphate dehydrogenase [Phenylobacterium sp.]